MRPEVASAIGIAAGTPVLAGGGDTHMSCIGIGHAEPGDITVVAGSTTPVMLASADPPLDAVEQPVVSPHVFPGTWAAETNAGATGIRFTWLLGLAHELGAAGAVLRRPDTPGGIRPGGSTRPVRRRRQPVLGRGGLGLDAGGRAARPDAVPFGRGCRAGAARGLGHRGSGADRAPRADAARRGAARTRHGRSEPQPVLVPAARRRLRPPDRNGRRRRALVAGGGAGRPRRRASAAATGADGLRALRTCERGARARAGGLRGALRGTRGDDGMTRVICVAPLIDSARLFMQSELGWEIEERDELGSDADAAVAIVEAAPLGQARARCLAGATADRLGARRAGQRRPRRGDGARDSRRARARSQCGVRRRVHDRRDDRAAPPHRLHRTSSCDAAC